MGDESRAEGVCFSGVETRESFVFNCFSTGIPTLFFLEMDPNDQVISSSLSWQSKGSGDPLDCHLETP